MTPRRSYYWVGIPYAVMGIAMLVWTYLRAEWSIQLLALVPVVVAASVLDHWSNFVAPKLAWSRGAILFLTALILAPDTTAPLVGVAIGAAAGFTDIERLNLKPGRLLLNAGMLAVAWGTAGLAYEALGEQAPGPSLGFLSAAALAYAAQLSINTGLAALAVGTVFGGAAAVAVPASLLVMAPLTFLLSMAVAGVASVVSLAGPSFMPIAVISGAVVLAIPVIHARVAVVRRDVSAAVARAALVDGRLHSAEDHARLLNLTIRVGWRLGLAAEQLEQLVYLTTLFVVTDLYAAYLPRSVEQELAGAAQRSSSWTRSRGTCYRRPCAKGDCSCRRSRMYLRWFAVAQRRQYSADTSRRHGRAKGTRCRGAGSCCPSRQDAPRSILCSHHGNEPGIDATQAAAMADFSPS